MNIAESDLTPRPARLPDLITQKSSTLRTCRVRTSRTQFACVVQMPNKSVHQDRFLPECDSQLLRAQFACVVQMPNKSVQKLHAWMRVLYHLAYPYKGTHNEVYLIEKIIWALNNREVHNYVHQRKPTTYAKALSIANEETSFVLMDIARYAPGGLRAPVPGDNSFIATLRAKHTNSGLHSAAKRKCYYCDEEVHIKERCPVRLEGFLKQR